jgi:hypothetical protein
MWVRTVCWLMNRSAPVGLADRPRRAGRIAAQHHHLNRGWESTSSTRAILRQHLRHGILRAATVLQMRLPASRPPAATGREGIGTMGNR